MLWYIEWEHQANCITTCEMTDCRRGERRGCRRSRGTWKSCSNDLAMMATLIPTPRNLHDVWHKFHHGVGRRKAARLFSYSEQGCSKHRYHRRKLVWDLVLSLVRMGDTAETTIDKKYAVYGGQTSVTNKINN
jgi:hypothetical protein